MNPLFQVHKLNEVGFAKANELAEAFNTLVEKIDNLIQTHPSREKSIVYTKLEEACFFAKKALASQKANQA